MEHSRLISRLTRIRATVRRRLLAYGLCVVAAGGVITFLTIVTLDWLLWLPSPLRMVVGALYLAGFVGAAVHWIARPLGARLELEEVAARLEERFGSLRDRLTSTVDFVQNGGAGSEIMMRQVVRNTERITENMPLESALSKKPLILRAGMTLASAVVLLSIIGTAPDWARMGFYRYVYPWGEIEWPHRVLIRPLTGDRMVAVGDSVTVRMEIQRGYHDDLRGIVRLVEEGGEELVLAMHRTGDGAFAATIDRVTRNLTYWFEAGDDSTARHPLAIQAVGRPEVVQALAVVQPPPYAAGDPARVRDLGDGPVHAPIGGAVRVSILASKPTATDAHGGDVGLRFDDDRFVALSAEPGDDRKLSARLEIRGDLHFRASLRDRNGFENRGTDQYSILAVPDRAPTVAVLEPAAMIELTPNGSVGVLIRAEDDFGITQLDLEVQRGGGETQLIGLTDSPHDAEGESSTVDETGRTVRYAWSMKPLSLSPGDLLSYAAVATDNRLTLDAGGQVGRSATMNIRIISGTEFETRLRSDVALLESWIRELVLDEADLLDRTQALQRNADDEGQIGAAQREEAAALATKQVRLVRRLRDLGERFQALIVRMQQNQTADETWKDRMAALAERARTTASGSMTAAARSLDELRERIDRNVQQDHLARAVRAETEAIDALRSMLQEISEWGDFKELMAKTRELLDRQESLRARTAELGRSTLGQALDALTPQQVGDLKRVARSQEQLGTDVEQLLEDLKQRASRTDDQDPATAQQADAALRAARARDLSRQLRVAAETIARNRTAAATIAQKAAGDGIRRMIAALDERDTRQLEELRKRLTKAIDQVAELIEQQQSLRNATHEASLLGVDNADVEALVTEQRTIRRNTRQLGREFATSDRTLAAGQLVTEAASPMENAEGYLHEAKPAAATADQDEALAILREAHDLLDEIANELANQALRRSLAQIRESLEEILAAQQDVNTGIGELWKSLGDRRDPAQGGARLDRREARTATKLARRQGNVRQLLETQRKDFDRVVVYRWALQRVATWMEAGRERLRKRSVDQELVDLTSRIAGELEKLIQALVETEALPMDTQFVEAQQGGGHGPGSAAANKPIPTVAELLVLKAMQRDVNERTQSLNESIDIDRVDEAALRRLQAVGEDQVEVRRLSELVTQRARRSP